LAVGRAQHLVDHRSVDQAGVATGARRPGTLPILSASRARDSESGVA
jgi:hypothetical protein